MVYIRNVLFLILAVLFLGNSVVANGQEALVVGNAEVPIGGSSDAVVSWIDIDGQVQVLDMQLDLSGMPTGVSMQPIIVDFFSQNEETCDTNPTTVAPNVVVSCNEATLGHWIMGLEQSQGLPFGGDVIEFVRLRFSAASGAEEGSFDPAIVWLSGTPAGTLVDSGNAGFQVSVLPVTAILEVSPSELDFGEVHTGSTSPSHEITISNQGTDGVALQVSAISVSGPFSLVSGGTCALPFSLSDEESCSQRLVFSPTDDGPVDQLLTVVSDAGEVINSTVALSGEGIPPPVGLIFDQSPDYGVVGGPLYGAVVVQVVDANGDLFVSDSTTVVEISLANDPTDSAVLTGTTQLSVSNGVAVFNNLSMDQIGNGFELRASDQSGTLSSGDSDAFDVLPLDLFRDRFEQPD